MTDRRAFLNILFKSATAIAALPLIPREEIVQTILTGEKYDPITYDELFKLIEAQLPLLFEREDYFYRMLENRPVEMIFQVDMRIPLSIKPGGDFGDYEE